MALIIDLGHSAAASTISLPNKTLGTFYAYVMMLRAYLRSKRGAKAPKARHLIVNRAMPLDLSDAEKAAFVALLNATISADRSHCRRAFVPLSAFSTSWNRRGQRQPSKAPGERSTLLAKKRRR